MLIAACFKLAGPLAVVLPGVIAYHMFKDTLGPEDYLLAYPTLVAPMIDTSGSLYNYLQKINAAFFGPMLAVILLGMLSTRVSAFAAKAGLVGGPALFFLLVFSFDDPVQAFLQGVFGTSDEIHFLHFLAIAFVVVAAFLLVSARLRPARSRHAEPGPAPVDMTPWKHAKAMGVFVSVCSIGCYLLLAQ